MVQYTYSIQIVYKDGHAENREMRLLVLGGGGREHALCWKLAASPLVDKVYCAPGNGGTHTIATNIDLDVNNHGAIGDFCESTGIDLVVPGSEAFLVAGIVDYLTLRGIACFGPCAKAAKLESSKSFTKKICQDYAIPTASYGSFDTLQAAKAYIESIDAPFVIKEDGLAAGKGVTIAGTKKEAVETLAQIFCADAKDGARVVIEEFLPGEEVSFFALCDGTNVVPLTTAQDYKRAHDGDRGPNTGGMGATSPVDFMTPDMHTRVMHDIIHPTLKAMEEKGCPYKGVLYAGLMIHKDTINLLEYNVRFGDPECQLLMVRLLSDLVPLLKAACSGTLAKVPAPLWQSNHALTLVMAARGYPGSFERNTRISNLAASQHDKDGVVFHAGTMYKSDLSEDMAYATAGRVLNVTAWGPMLHEAHEKAYKIASRITWPEGFYRHDIGWRGLAYEKKRRIS